MTTKLTTGQPIVYYPPRATKRGYCSTRCKLYILGIAWDSCFLRLNKQEKVIWGKKIKPGPDCPACLKREDKDGNKIIK